MKKVILVKYYSKYNLGDDLFLEILSENFQDCKIKVLANVAYLPKNRRKNLYIHPFSFLLTLLGKIQVFLGWENYFTYIIERYIQNKLKVIISKSDAYVNIGGSIFMQKKESGDELQFQTKEAPRFEFNSCLRKDSNKFIIGANLGPVYSKQYWCNMRDEFSNYAHVCLRDYSSYCMLKDLAHIQYAPDVVFLTKPEDNKDKCENIIISIIDVSQHTTNTTVIEAYYNLLRSVVVFFSSKQISVKLVSLCKREGDEKAVNRLWNMLSDHTYVSTYFYNGNTREALKCFSNASFIIATRFHSMILGFVYGKPVFPISYNCKTWHYISDLKFEGKYTMLEDILNITYEDVLYNYEKHIIVDCSLHKKYAENQFVGLRMYIDAISKC